MKKKIKVKGGGRDKAHKVPKTAAVPETDKPISLFGDLEWTSKIKPEEEEDLCVWDEFFERTAGTDRFEWRKT